MPHGEGTLLYDGLKVVGHFRYGKITDMTDWKGANKEMAERITLGSRVNLKYQLTCEETITDTDSKISKKEYQKQKTFGNKRDLMSKSSKDKKVKYIDKENSQKDKSKTKDKENEKEKNNVLNERNRARSKKKRRITKRQRKTSFMEKILMKFIKVFF